jgi:N-methylhydantoinase A
MRAALPEGGAAEHSRERRAMLRVATDVGGTFTDLVACEVAADGRQIVRIAKVDTTPPGFERGVLDAVSKAGLRVGEIDFFAHGTTVIINALAERTGAVTALITTAGFRDVLEIARGDRPDFFNLGYLKPKPFVPRRLRREVPGRISYRGEELAPLDLSGLPAVLQEFRAEGVQAVAVCLLHAYANPAHEQAVLAGIARLWPDVSAVASHQITREWREYERSNTTVLSAYVQPVAEAYLSRLQTAMRARGFGGRLYVMQSNCGVDTLETARRVPVTMVESGPASGFWGAAELGRLIGEPNVLAIDIGGTTAKCALIERGEVKIRTDYWIERDRRSAGYPIMVPVVDLVEIGNGGGSIAWVDAFGKLHVGPRSAGAVPGPAAYGRGGEQPTTTDANLALGRIDPDYFCGGSVRADMTAVGAALDMVAAPLGLDRAAAARGIVRIANNNMVNALKLVSLNRGFDPRDFALVAFGGGGGMHASALAAELNIRKIVVPRGASVFSAWGMMMSDLRRDHFSTRLVAEDDAEGFASAVARARVDATAAFVAEGIAADTLSVRVWAKCRYQNQEHSVEVSVEDDGMTALKRRFGELYEREYTYRLDAPMEVVGLHVAAAAQVGKLQPAELPVTGATLARAMRGRRAVDYATEGIHDATVYDLEHLEPGMALRGPAVIEDPDTTILLHPTDAATVDRFGNIHIEVGGAGA